MSAREFAVAPPPQERLGTKVARDQPRDGNTLGADRYPAPVHRDQDVAGRIDRKAKLGSLPRASRLSRRAKTPVVVGGWQCREVWKEGIGVRGSGVTQPVSLVDLVDAGDEPRCLGAPLAGQLEWERI